MSDWIEHDGKKYYEESYLRLANNSTARKVERITLLEAQITALRAALEQIQPLLEEALGDYHDTNELMKIKNITVAALAASPAAKEKQG